MRSPFADAYLGRFAAALVDQLQLGNARRHRPARHQLLRSSICIGHTFGPRSQEVREHLRAAGRDARRAARSPRSRGRSRAAMSSPCRPTTASRRFPSSWWPSSARRRTHSGGADRRARRGADRARARRARSARGRSMAATATCTSRRVCTISCARHARLLDDGGRAPSRRRRAWHTCFGASS